MSQKLPNFLIAGTAKSGTTSLHYYLQQHPQVFMPRQIKETYFLIEPKSLLGKPDKNLRIRIVDTLAEYLSLFSPVDCSRHKAIGEATPIYLFFYKNTIPNIKRYLGDPKIIAILRNPVERAYSNHLHHVRDNFDEISFEKALELEKERKRNNRWYSYRISEMGHYYDQIKAYLDNFSRVKVFLFDDLNNFPEKTLKDVFDFLEVDSSFVPDFSEKHNVTGTPKNRLFHKFLTTDNRVRSFLRPVVLSLMSKDRASQLVIRLKTRNLEKPQLNPETKKKLQEQYRNDILKLQNLLNRDLSHWLTD